MFSKDGVIRYTRSAKSFPRLAVRAGNPLPADCASLRAPVDLLRIATPWAELDGSVWLQTEWGQKAPTVLEQTMRQRNGFQVSSLSIRTEQSENESDEEAEITVELGTTI